MKARILLKFKLLNNDDSALVSSVDYDEAKYREVVDLRQRRQRRSQHQSLIMMISL